MLLRTRIIVFVLAVVSGVASMVFAVSVMREREMSARIAELQLQQFEQAWNNVVATAADGVSERLNDSVTDRERLGDAIDRGDQHALEALGAHVLPDNAYLRANVFGAGGDLLWSSDGALNPIRLIGTRRPSDMQEGNRSIGGPRWLADGMLGLVGTMPVMGGRRNHGGTARVVGLVAAAVPLTGAIETFRQSYGGRVYVRDLDGAPYYGQDDALARAAQNALSSTRRGLAIIEQDGRHYEAARLPLSDLMGGRLATMLLVRDVTGQVDARTLWNKVSLGAIGFAFATAMLMLYLYLRRNFAVLDDAVNALHQMASGERGAYVELPQGSDEIGRIAESVEAFGKATAEVARAGALRDRRQRRQQRFIRRQMEQLAANLEDEARDELLAELAQIEGEAADASSAQSKAVNDELGLMALGFSRLATKVSIQQVQLTHLVRDLRMALEDKRKLISLQQELEIAANMQLSILPREFPDLPMLDIATYIEPAKEVGGDFYDVFAVRDGTLGVVIADVSGKGIPAAFFMLISRTMLRTVAAEGNGPAQTLARLNNLLSAENEQVMFVTLFYAEIDLASGTVAYSNGGHNPPFLAGADGAVRKVDTTVGTALATFPDLPFTERTLVLAPGDALFLYTDGVTEAFAADQRMFGTDRLQEVLVQRPVLSAEAALQSVVSAVSDFTSGAEQSDDITAVMLQWRGGVPESR